MQDQEDETEGDRIFGEAGRGDMVICPTCGSRDTEAMLTSYDSGWSWRCCRRCNCEFIVVKEGTEEDDSDHAKDCWPY